jgi:L-2,4-diaminobutyrate decarboxylase
MKTFLSDMQAVVEAVNHFHEESIERKRPILNQTPIQQVIENMDLAGHIRAGDLRGEILVRFIETYLSFATRLHHPGYLAHQVAVPHPAGSIASLIDGFTNNVTSIYEMGSSATAIEFFLLNWLIEKVGWEPSPLPAEDKGESHAGGVFTHGGSLANLTALLAARSRAVADVWEGGSPGNFAILAPAESHYSIARTAGIMGMGKNAIYQLPTDMRGAVIADKIPSTLARVRADNRLPIAIVANACSTAAGIYDPLREIGEAAQSAGVWFHVDAAHGAAALLSDKYRHLLDGISLAESMVWDAHKLMRTPALCTAVLVRDARTLDDAFKEEASYIFHDKDQPGVDFVHRTMECTKAPLGLKFYMILASMGEEGLAWYIENCFDLAQAAYSHICGLTDFECAAQPQANILCFRLKDSDRIQMLVRARIIAKGDFYISTAEIGGKRYLRTVFTNPQTTMEDVKHLIDAIREIARTVASEQQAAFQQ